MYTDPTTGAVSEDPLTEFFGSLLAAVLIGTIEDHTKK
jgi:hypothetical protein